MKENIAVTNERVRILYSKAFASISTALAAALGVVYIFREQIASSVLLAWLGFMLVVSLVRYWLLFDYRKHNKVVVDHRRYENRFIYSTGVVGVGWAFFIMQGLYLPAFEYHIYSLLLLVAIIAVAAPIFSSSIKTVYAYIAPPLITTIPFLLLRGGMMLRWR